EDLSERFQRTAHAHLDGDAFVEFFLAALEIGIADDRTLVFVLDARGNRLLQTLGEIGKRAVRVGVGQERLIALFERAYLGQAFFDQRALRDDTGEALLLFAQILHLRG